MSITYHANYILSFSAAINKRLEDENADVDGGCSLQHFRLQRFTRTPNYIKTKKNMLVSASQN